MEIKMNKFKLKKKKRKNNSNAGIANKKDILLEIVLCKEPFVLIVIEEDTQLNFVLEKLQSANIAMNMVIMQRIAKKKTECKACK